MPLHSSKTIAILQWYNSLSSQDLQNIKQLSDGKFLCDIIQSTFDDVSLTDPIYGKLPVDSSTEQPPKDDITEQSPMDTTTAGQSPTESDIQMEGIDSVKEAVDSVKEAVDSVKEADDSVKKVVDSDKETIDSVKKAVPSSSCSDAVEDLQTNEISQRFKFLQMFIDDTYSISSENIITYSECMKSDELELAKAAILILSAVVKHLLNTKNDKLNTLTLLDHKIQEDIEECLAVLLNDVNKLSRKDLQKVLSKQARYKISPRKSSSSSVTPQRRCASKYKNSSPSPTTQFSEEVFTNSPLKSFLESPLFQRQMLNKDKELIRTRKTLHAEEIKCEDLQLQSDDLQKQLDIKDKEIKRLKSELKKCNAQLSADCENCKEMQDTVEISTTLVEKLKGEYRAEKAALQTELTEYKDLVRRHEEEVSRYTSLITKLEGRVKVNVKNALDEERNALVPLLYDQKCHVIEAEREKVKELEFALEGLKRNHAATIAQFEDRLTEAKALLKPSESPGVKENNGECIGSIIDEENRILHFKLNEAELQIAELQKRLDVNNEMIRAKRNMSSCSKDDSDLSVTEPMDIAPLPHSTRRRSLRNVKRNSSGSSDCSISSYMNVIDITPQKSDSLHTNVNGRPNLANDECVLWAKYEDSDCQRENSYENANLHSESTDRPMWDGFRDPDYRRGNSSGMYLPSSSENDLASSRVHYENKTTQIPDNGNSLWDDYNSNSQRENSSGTFLPSITDNGLSNSLDLYKQIGIAKSELSAKIKSLKKIISLLKEVFSKKCANGFIGVHSLGDWEQKLKSDDDYILCLFYIKESLLKFLNSLHKNCIKDKIPFDNVEDSKNSVKDEELLKISCKCDTVQELEDLKKENYELNVKLSELLGDFSKLVAFKRLKQEKEELQQKIQILEMSSNDQIEKKIIEIDELKKKICILESQYKDLLISYETLESKNAELTEKYSTMKSMKDKLSAKVSEYSNLKVVYNDLVGKSKKMQYMVNKEVAEKERDLLVFEEYKRNAIAAIEREKKLKKMAYSKCAALKETFEHQKAELETQVTSLIEEVQKLAKLYEAAENRYENSERKVKALTSALSASEQHSSRSQNPDMVVKKMKVEFEMGDRPGCSSEPDFVMFDVVRPNIHDVTPLDTGNESTLSSTLPNRSIHSGFLRNDDEEDFLNHSSIAEIKRDYDASADKSTRLQELHRRNTMCLPHMQSSYPIELQSMSPCDPTGYQYFQNRARRKELAAAEVPATKKEELKKEALIKKRKISELDNNCGEGTSRMGSTPVRKIPKTFKTPSSLQKLLKFRRHRHTSIVKPKP